jgi:hypothetical protein
VEYLDPTLPPVFRGVYLDADGLAALPIEHPDGRVGKYDVLRDIIDYDYLSERVHSPALSALLVRLTTETAGWSGTVTIDPAYEEEHPPSPPRRELAYSIVNEDRRHELYMSASRERFGPLQELDWFGRLDWPTPESIGLNLAIHFLATVARVDLKVDLDRAASHAEAESHRASLAARRTQRALGRLESVRQRLQVEIDRESPERGDDSALGSPADFESSMQLCGRLGSDLDAIAVLVESASKSAGEAQLAATEARRSPLLGERQRAAESATRCADLAESDAEEAHGLAQESAKQAQRDRDRRESLRSRRVAVREDRNRRLARVFGVAIVGSGSLVVASAFAQSGDVNGRSAAGERLTLMLAAHFTYLASPASARPWGRSPPQSCFLPGSKVHGRMDVAASHPMSPVVE